MSLTGSGNSFILVPLYEHTTIDVSNFNADGLFFAFSFWLLQMVLSYTFLYMACAEQMCAFLLADIRLLFTFWLETQ